MKSSGHIHQRVTMIRYSFAVVCCGARHYDLPPLLFVVSR